MGWNYHSYCPNTDCLYFPHFSSYSICVIGVTAQAFIGQASKAATEGQEALKGLNQKEQAAILQVWHDLMD